MTVALKGSLTWESVLVRVSSRRTRRATSWGMVRDGAAARVGRVMRRRRRVTIAREHLELEETKFNGDLSYFRMVADGMAKTKSRSASGMTTSKGKKQQPQVLRLRSSPSAVSYFAQDDTVLGRVE